MVTLISLLVMAGISAALAVMVAWFRRLEVRVAIGDGGAAWLAVLAAIVVADLFFLLSQPLEAPVQWRYAGSLALLLSPIAATVALRLRGSRSIPRALVVSAIALGLLVVWLTLRLEGPRGGWRAGQVAVATAASSLLVSSAACVGWWSKTVLGRSAKREP